MFKVTQRLSFILIVAVAFLLTVPAYAVDALSQGPKVGSKIPHTLSTNDQHNKAQSFDALKGKRGLILFFTRSFDW